MRPRRLALALLALALFTAAATCRPAEAATGTLATASPAGPAFLRAAARSALVRLSWATPVSPAGPVLGYAVYRSAGGAAPASLLVILPGNADSYADYQVVNDQSYTYVVRALHDSKTESPDSTRATATPAAENLRLSLSLGEKVALVNSSAVTLDAPAKIVNGRTVVPLRFVASTLGATVAYDARLEEIRATLGRRTVRLWLDTPKAEIDGRPVTIAAPPVLEHGRTLVPLRFISEAFGAQVGYDSAAGRVSVTLVDTDSDLDGADMGLAVGTPLAAALSGGDADVYRCSVVPGKTYRAVVSRPESGRAAVLSLVDPAQDSTAVVKGAVVTSSVLGAPADGPTPGGLRAELEVASDPGQTFLYFRVQAADPDDGGSTGSYTISVEETTEPQDTPAGAAWLAVGPQATQGYLHSPSDTDYFRFEAQAGLAYAVEVAAGEVVATGGVVATGEVTPPFEALVELSGPDASVIMRDDRADSGSSDEAGQGSTAGGSLPGADRGLLWECEQAGPYVVAVSSLNGGWGPYTVRVSPTAPEPPEGPRTAEVLLPDHDARRRWLPSALDQDWFAFPTQRGENYYAQALDLTEGCDTVLTLFGYDGKELASNDDGLGRVWPDGGSLVSFTAVYDGLVYARVTALAPPDGGRAGLGGYTFAVTGTGPETDGRPGQARLLGQATPSWVSSLVDGDRDWYRFEVDRGLVYTLETGNLEAGCDTDLAVYDEHWRLLASNDDADGGLASRVAFTAGFSGPAYACVSPVFVTEISDGTGVYTITLRAGSRASE